MTTSLDRKIEVAAKRAAAERAERGGYVPVVKKTYVPAPGGGWYEPGSKHGIIYITSDGRPPAEDLSNVTSMEPP